MRERLDARPAQHGHAEIEDAAVGVRAYIRAECGTLDYTGRIAALTLAIADELAESYGNAPARLAAAVQAVEATVRSLTRAAASAGTAPGAGNGAGR